MFASFKEKALAAGIKGFINREIKEFGEVKDVAIDTREKTLRVEVDLTGEASPIVITVGSYELSEKNGKVFLQVKKVTASRPWITAAVSKYAVGRAFPLPDAAKMLL